MRFRVQKLIRDGLPAMMRAEGLEVFERRLDDSEFVAALKDKLVEEAAEARATTDMRDLAEELADLMEVVRTLAGVTGLSLEEIEGLRQAKHAERGGFENRVFNAAVEAREDLPAAAYYLARPERYPRED